VRGIPCLSSDQAQAGEVATCQTLLAVIGMAMAFGLLLLQAVDAHGYGELGSGVLYVISGAIFPITVLPGILATLASMSPLGLSGCTAWETWSAE